MLQAEVFAVLSYQQAYEFDQCCNIKLGKLSQTKLSLRLFYIRNHNIIVAQVRYIIIETKEVARIQLITVIFILYSSKSNEKS
jgi:hypothetical protein